MDRREFLHTSVIATLTGKVLSDVTLAGLSAEASAQAGLSAEASAQAGLSAEASAQAGAQTPAQAGTPPAPAVRHLTIDAYTRCLHWLRDPDDIAEAAIEMTCGGVEPTVQAYPGHINPDKVAQEFPPFVKTMQKHGLRVKQVRGGNQTDVNGPNVEAIVGTMGQLGVTHYWMGTDNYDL